MSLHGIKSFRAGSLDDEIISFLQREGFESNDTRDRWEKYITIIDNASEFMIFVYGNHITVQQRYGGGDWGFQFDDHASFVEAYNSVVDMIPEGRDY